MRYALHAYPAFAVLIAGAACTANGERWSQRATAVAAVALPLTALGALAATAGVRLAS